MRESKKRGRNKERGRKKEKVRMRENEILECTLPLVGTDNTW